MILWALLLLLFSQTETRPLSVGLPLERELAGGQAHSYQIAPLAEQYLHIAVEQRGIDVAVTLFGPDDKKLMEENLFHDSASEEVLMWVTNMAGTYRVEVRSLDKEVRPGKYQIKFVELRNAVPNDRPLVEARQLAGAALLLAEQNKADEALPLAQKVLALREKMLGPEHAEVGAALNFLAGLYFDKGEFKTAEPIYVRALVVREKSLGPENLDVAESVNDLAVTYLSLGEYERALPFYQRALDIYTKLLGPDDPQIAASLSNLAGAYQRKSDYAQAESLYRRALAIREKNFGAEHYEIAESLGDLAALYRDTGEYPKAEPLHLRALSIKEKALGKTHPEVASTLNNLGLLYHERGDYAQAEPLYQRAIEIREKVLGQEHPFLATTISNLAALYADRGDLLKAVPLQLRSITIKEKVYGNEHPDLARSFNLLAGMYREQGHYAEAEKLHQRALAMREKIFGDHPETALSLFSFARLYQVIGKATQAEMLYRRALTVLEKTVGGEHPYIVQALEGLGDVYNQQGNTAEAEKLYQRALRIQQKTLHADAPDIARTLSRLSSVSWAKGELPQSIVQLTQALELSERHLARNLLFGSERQKLSYLQLFSADTNNALSLHAQAAPRDASALELALTTLLRRKGRGLDVLTDSMAVLRRRANPEDQARLTRLGELRSRIATLALRNVESTPAANAQLKPLEDEAEQLEAELSTRSAEFRSQTQTISLTAIQHTLPSDAMLIEFAHYTPLEARTRKLGAPHYAAYVLSAEGEPRWVDLGAAAVIERAIAGWRQALRDPQRTDAQRLARVVDDKVMKPLRPLLGTSRQLLISPDGVLNLIPFVALVDEQNQYLVERYTISYLTSGRDLLRLQTSRASHNDAVIVADPEFGDPPVVIATNDASRKGTARLDESKVLFLPLAKTRTEARALKELLPRSVVLSKTQATEAALRQLSGPRILHIATHGFFFQDKDPATRGGEDLRLGKWVAKVQNPLLRSGLALAGANQGKSGDDDGVLTAMEAASLDLWGTKLVVLSACDTGVGEIRNGEGVYGLRRALVLAGAETQLMSLWPVSDSSTSELMIGYYKALQQGQGRGEALRQSQLQMLRTTARRHPFYWASFIPSGEWATLDGQR